jgi:preprotein translocase subunit YajC
VEGLLGLAPFIAIAAIFYLLLIRPQRKRQLEVQATQRAVTVGDEVLLGAGIVGRVAGESDEFLELEISPGVHMKVARGAVVRVLLPEGLEDHEDHEDFGAGDEESSGSTAADLTDPTDPTTNK